MLLRLYTRDKKPVGEAVVPNMAPPPDVVVWSDRVFVKINHFRTSPEDEIAHYFAEAEHAYGLVDAVKPIPLPSETRVG